MKNLCCILFGFLLALSGKNVCAQEDTWVDDSTHIVQNADELFNDYTRHTLNQELLANLLNFAVKNKNGRTDELVDYYIALFYLENKEIQRALAVINKRIEGEVEVAGIDAKFYKLKGDIYYQRGNLNRAIKAYLTASYRYQNLGNKLKEAEVYRNIADIYISFEDYQQAYKYAKWSFDEYIRFPEVNGHLRSLGLLVLCENNLGMLDSAEIHINYGMEFLPFTQDDAGKIIVNYAKSELEFIKGNYHKAQPFAIISLRLSENYNYDRYSALILRMLAAIHNRLGEYALALNFGFSALDYIDKSKDLSLEYGVRDEMAFAYAGLGDFYKAYTNKYRADSIKTIDKDLKNKRNLDSLLVKFQMLSSENKILGQEAIIANQNHLLEKRRNYLLMGAFVLSLLIIFIVVIFVLNNQRIDYIKKRQEVDLVTAINDSEESERNKLASELHDGLAAELTALKLELEQNENTSDRAFFMLNKAHQMSRNISHNLNTHFISEIGLIEALVNLISSYNINKNIYFYTNINEKLELDGKVETILYRSTQELIQNALKHAHANEINVQAVKIENNLTISIEDDGVGITREQMKKSIGLNTLKQRILLINGNFELESLPNRGTSAFIKLNLG